ncbi:hypothetical protein EYF80_014491 [Liparis tanakae]|uniref:Uncharacterized protein n=1 Tax=Liparis tanakae TaxID=230148 RepID=A0A4Z2ID15_9TELE|nr:hypothetical protein EYF80_014491 [Liparis tanakae]
MISADRLQTKGINGGGHVAVISLITTFACLNSYKRRIQQQQVASRQPHNPCPPSSAPIMSHLTNHYRQKPLGDPQSPNDFINHHAACSSATQRSSQLSQHLCSADITAQPEADATRRAVHTIRVQDQLTRAVWPSCRVYKLESRLGGALRPVAATQAAVGPSESVGSSGFGTDEISHNSRIIDTRYILPCQRAPSQPVMKEVDASETRGI